MKPRRSFKNRNQITAPQGSFCICFKKLFLFHVQQNMKKKKFQCKNHFNADEKVGTKWRRFVFLGKGGPQKNKNKRNEMRRKEHFVSFAHLEFDATPGAGGGLGGAKFLRPEEKKKRRFFFLTGKEGKKIFFFSGLCPPHFKMS